MPSSICFSRPVMGHFCSLLSLVVFLTGASILSIVKVLKIVKSNHVKAESVYVRKKKKALNLCVNYATEGCCITSCLCFAIFMTGFKVLSCLLNGWMPHSPTCNVYKLLYCFCFIDVSIGCLFFIKFYYWKSFLHCHWFYWSINSLILWGLQLSQMANICSKWLTPYKFLKVEC